MRKNSVEKNIKTEVENGDRINAIFTNESEVISVKQGEHKEYLVTDFSHNEITIKLDEDSSLDLKIVNTTDTEKNLKIKGKACRNAIFSSILMDVSNQNTTINIDFDLAEEGAEGSFKYSSLSKKNSTKTYDVSFNHLKGYTTSNFEGYGVCDSGGEMNVFGISTIYEKAIKSNANQKVKVILFDETAKVKASPSLKIDCDDVKASHGCAIGTVNKDHLYYLCSRGMSELEAKKLITYGYLLPLAQKYDEDTRNSITEQIYWSI